MKNIENIINYVFGEFSSKCPSFRSGICTRNGGCLCKTFSEEKGYSLGIVPEKYKNKNIYSIPEIKNINAEISADSIKTAQYDLWNFLYSGEFKQGLSQVELDLLSGILDSKVSSGCNLIIHGSPHTFFDEKIGISKILPTGKSLIASVAMKQIIRRRIYNRAINTYDWVSFPEIKSNIFGEGMISDYGDIDCLVIDDIDISPSRKEKYDKIILSKLEEFYSYRISNKKSNILVFSQDLASYDIAEMGYSLAKIISGSNTTVIKIS